MYGWERKIGTFNLPDLNWLEPMIRFVAAIIAEVRFRLRYYVILKEFCMILEVFFFESRANLFIRKYINMS